MNEREYRRLREEIERDYRKKLDALETIWKLAGPGPGRASQPRGSVVEAVRQTVPAMGEEFTPRTLHAKLAEGFPDIAATLKRATLSSVLNRLTEDGDLEVVEKGSGKRPSTYRAKGLNEKTAV